MSSDAAVATERATGYEFTSSQNTVIDALGKKMKLVGLVVLIFGALNLVNAVLVQILFAQASRGSLPEDITKELIRVEQADRWIVTCYLAVVGIVFLAVGVWTRSAGCSFAQIVTTRGRDINHLMDGFNTLNKMYSLIATTLLAAILAYLVLIAVTAMR